MKKILQYVPTYVLFFLIIGIVVGYYFELTKSILLSLLFISTFFLLFFYIKTKRKDLFNVYFSIALFFVSFSIGLGLIHFKKPINQKNHYIHLIQKNDGNNFYHIEVSIRKVLKPTQYHQKYEASVKTVNGLKYTGKLLLNVLNDSTNTLLQVDQNLAFFTTLTSINSPKNPYTFDYQRYMLKQQIHHQATIKYNELYFLTKETTFLGLAAELRAEINYKLNQFNISSNEIAVINALLLGQRQDISQELMENYINAGAVHILAVSGLHIGIILLILQFLLSPIERLKNGKVFKFLCLIKLLWMYAVIAGLSPSVIRAVSMFSILAIGMNLKKLTHIYYTLILSALVLLLVNPYLLFEVGFQLSYTAVLSIVIFQPIFQSFWRPKNKIVLFYWNVFTVSLAAQLGVLPVSLYYFHQFPGLFFLTNLIIIPFLGIILLGGLLVFFLALINSLPFFLLKAYTSIIYLMNLCVKWVGTQEQFLIQEIPFNVWMLLAVFLILITVLNYYNYKSYANLNLVLVAIIVFQLLLINQKYYTVTNKALIVFHKSKATVIGKHTGIKLDLFTTQDSILLFKNSFLKSFRIEKSIDKQVIYPLKKVFYTEKDSVLVLDHENFASQLDFNPSILILSNSPKINLNRLLSRIKPRLVIADGSNFVSYVKSWEASCKQTKTPFHHTGQKGAFILVDN